MAVLHYPSDNENDKVYDLKRNHLSIHRNWSDVYEENIRTIDYINTPLGFRFVPNYNKRCTPYDILFKTHHIFIEGQGIASEQIHNYNRLMHTLFYENSIDDLFIKNMSQLEKQKHILMDHFDNIMILSEDNKMIITDSIVYMEGLNIQMCFSSNLNYIKCGDKQLVFKITSGDKLILDSTMKFRNKSEKVQYTSENGEFTQSTIFKNSDTNLNVVIYKKVKQNGDVEEHYNKNGMFGHLTYNNKKKQSVLVTQCMMGGNSNSEIRYRGIYKEIKCDGQIVKKSLSKDDEIIYNRKGNEVLIDKIKQKEIRNEIMIGWKVAKSSNGEKRIVKLGIPIDAKVIKPVSSDYFQAREKERCNKAFVLDIQYPTKEETSVVPDELEAYSYVFTDNGTTLRYKVGKEVIPDSFDENENESCTKGIHFYQNRNTVFEMYINN